MDLAPPGALRDLGPLILGDDRQHLSQQHALGRAIVGFLGEDDLHPRAVKLFLQQHLVGEIAAQTVHRPDQDGLDPAACNRVAQGFQRGTIQRRATDTVGGEHLLLRDDPTAAARVFQHRFTLTGDRFALLLESTRHSQVRRHRSRHGRQSGDFHRGLLLWTKFALEPTSRRLLRGVRAPAGRRPEPGGCGAFDPRSRRTESERWPGPRATPGCVLSPAPAPAIARPEAAGGAP